MDGVRLYNDQSEAINPQSTSKCITGYTSGYTVWDDFKKIYDDLTLLRIIATGGEAVANNLGVVVKYLASNINDATLIAKQTFNSDVIILPTADAPYAWLKTMYKWGEDVIKTTYTIVATALYPETQVMYASIPSILVGNNISGPSNYGDNEVDTTNNTITWDSYFRGISAENPYGYMAIRHRDAGKLFEIDDNTQKPVWHISLFAQYPISNNLPSE